MYADRLWTDAHSAGSLQFVGVLLQESVGMLLGILEQALAFTFMDFPWVATAGTASELVFGALENPSNGADGDLKILCKLPLGYRLALIAFMDALSRVAPRGRDAYLA